MTKKEAQKLAKWMADNDRFGGTLLRMPASDHYELRLYTFSGDDIVLASVVIPESTELSPRESALNIRKKVRESR